MAVDLSRAVGWWEEWQLRILVLGSLFLQLVLFAGSMVRNLRIPMSRLCIWLGYLGADALAIYALATLFNRHKQPPGAGSSSALEVLWAPVLLIHLGGQHAITAYSIEDNELWRRHIVTVVSQVTVALYVFCKSWPHGGDKRLLQAAILLFVVGILKLIRKPLTLKSASLGSVMTSSIVYPETREENCLGLDLRVKFSPSEMLPNLFAGPQRNGAKRTRRYQMNTKKRKLEDHDLRAEGYHLLKAEGNGWLPRSASANTKAFGPKGTASIAPKVTNGHPEA